MSRRNRIILAGAAVGILAALALIPASPRIPVVGADRHSWSRDSFWHYPWGKSVTHKGIDIFARRGISVISATPGVCVFSGTLPRGGKVALVLGPQLRLYYYAHLDSIRIHTPALVRAATQLGTVGDSGNAVGTPPHLHFSIVTLVPYPWRVDGSVQGWKKMFYLNPDEVLLSR